MPTYLYECSLCHESAEVIRQMADRDRPMTCLKCGGRCDRLITAPAYCYVKGSKSPKPPDRKDWNYALGCPDTDSARSAKLRELEAKGTPAEKVK